MSTGEEGAPLVLRCLHDLSPHSHRSLWIAHTPLIPPLPFPSLPRSFQFRALRTPIPLEEVVDCLLQVLDGVQHLERCGVYHSDLKPANTMVVKAGDKSVLKVSIAEGYEGE